MIPVRDVLHMTAVTVTRRLSDNRLLLRLAAHYADCVGKVKNILNIAAAMLPVFSSFPPSKDSLNLATKPFSDRLPAFL